MRDFLHLRQAPQELFELAEEDDQNDQNDKWTNSEKSDSEDKSSESEQGSEDAEFTEVKLTSKHAAYLTTDNCLMFSTQNERR